MQQVGKNLWQAQHLKLDIRDIDAEFALTMGSRNQKLRLVEGLLLVSGAASTACFCMIVAIMHTVAR